MTSEAPGASEALGAPEVLAGGDLELQGRIVQASNATFLGRIAGQAVVYKPVAGEQPLWDFPDHTLARRELAAYLVSEATGWDIVPQTWLQEGPFGLGMVQRWCEPDADQEAITIVAPDQMPEHGWCHVFDGIDAEGQPVSLIHEDSDALRRMAIFDALINNADRKGGHVLEMTDGHRYGVDHGLTFHTEYKLRTVLWGWAGQDFTEAEASGLQQVAGALAGDLAQSLEALLERAELEALRQRCEMLALDGRFPQPRDDEPVIPWPPF